jgi:hypothetical protein
MTLPVVNKGNKVRIICQGESMIGVVDYVYKTMAYHKKEGKYKLSAYSLAITQDDGISRIWMSHVDGGTIEVLE